MQTVRVAFAANDTYIPMFGVALHSLIKHADPGRKYNIFLLNEGVGNGHWKRIKEMEQPNINIERVDVAEKMKEHDIPTVNHLSKETTYRLLIDDLFKDCDKILYLDSDILIREDVSRLFDEDLDGSIFAASRARLFPYSVEYIRDELCIRTDDYFNAGVLLVNIPLFRKHKIGEKALEMLSGKTFNTQDQDVLNILGQAENADYRVKLLDGRWNYEWEHLVNGDVEPYIDEARKDSLEMKDDAHIIHYTTAKKPWNHPELELADEWWAEARETVFYEELLMYGAGNHFSDRLTKVAQAFDMYLFPWNEIKPGENVIIYGGGVVGQAFIEQIRLTQYCRLIAVCDKNAAGLKGLTVPAVTPDELSDFPRTRIVIAIDKQKTADAIRDDLVTLGIDKEMIIWQSYRRK